MCLSAETRRNVTICCDAYLHEAAGINVNLNLHTHLYRYARLRTPMCQIEKLGNTRRKKSPKQSEFLSN